MTIREYFRIIDNPEKYSFSNVQTNITFLDLITLGISNKYNKQKQRLYLILGEKGDKKFKEIGQTSKTNREKNQETVDLVASVIKQQKYNPIGIYQKVVRLDKGGDKLLTQEAKRRLDAIYANKSSDNNKIFKDVDFKKLNKDIFGKNYDHYTGKS